MNASADVRLRCCLHRKALVMNVLLLFQRGIHDRSTMTEALREEEAAQEKEKVQENDKNKAIRGPERMPEHTSENKHPDVKPEAAKPEATEEKPDRDAEKKHIIPFFHRR